MLNGILQQQQCFWKCNIDGSLDQPDYYLNRADCQRKMGQNLRRGYTWIGVKFEIMLRGIVRIKMGWKHYQTVDHPKKEPLVGRGLFGICLLLYGSVRALWLAAERALFSWNDRAFFEFFFAVQRLFWVVTKTTCAWAKTTEKMDKVQLYFQ